MSAFKSTMTHKWDKIAFLVRVCREVKHNQDDKLVTHPLHPSLCQSLWQMRISSSSPCDERQEGINLVHVCVCVCTCIGVCPPLCHTKLCTMKKRFDRWLLVQFFQMQSVLREGQRSCAALLNSEHNQHWAFPSAETSSAY